MNSLPVTRVFVGAHAFCTPSSRDAERARIAAAMASYSGPIKCLPAYEPKPRPARSGRIDPETILVRKPRPEEADAIIFAAIREMIDESAGTIVKALAKRGMKVSAFDVARVAELRGIELRRAWD